MSEYNNIAPVPIEIDTDAESASSAASPWGSLIGAFTGIGGLVLSIFEWYYQKKMEAWDQYWNDMINDSTQQLNQLEQEVNYYQSAAMQQKQLSSSYNNQVFSAPNKSYRSYYQRLLDSSSQKSVYYNQLAELVKNSINRVKSQIKQEQKQEQDFSMWTSSEDGQNWQTKAHIVNVHEDEIRKEQKNDQSILNQIISLEKTINSGSLTLTQLKSAIKEINSLNTKMEANNKWMNWNPDLMVKPMTGVLKSVTHVLKTAIDHKKITKDAHLKKKNTVISTSKKKEKTGPRMATRKRSIKH